jgi:hypothetical protein
MSAHAYTEEQLVEQPAIQLFKELGWTTVSALEEMWRRFWRQEPPGKPTPGACFALSGLGQIWWAVVWTLKRPCSWSQAQTSPLLCRFRSRISVGIGQLLA